MGAGVSSLAVAFVTGLVPLLEEHQGLRAEGDGCSRHINPHSPSDQEI